MSNNMGLISPATELQRLTRRLRRALARKKRTRGTTGPSGVRRAPAAAAAAGGVKFQPRVHVGPVGRLLVRILSHYPKRGQIAISSGYRPGTHSHHGGRNYKGSPTAAVDIVAGSAAGMRDVAKWLYENFADETVELIHTTPFRSDRGFYVKNQKKYPGGGIYGPATRRQHRDHVHFASSKALAQKILAQLESKGRAAAARPFAARDAARPASAAKAGARPLRLSRRGAAFIARHEGTKLRLYNDPAGHCTIGIGHLVHRGRCNGSEPAEFKRGITRERAYQLLQQDARRFEKAVNGLGVPLNQNQFDALVSFTYNLGPAWTVQNTGIRRALLQRRYKDVPREMMKWVKAGSKTLPGLVKRRRAEGKLFSTPAGPGQQPGPKVVNLADVQPGQNNDSVLVVQQALAKAVGLDYSSGPGNFGPATTAAYAEWQRKCGIPENAANGTPDAKSLKMLGDKFGFTVRAAAPAAAAAGATNGAVTDVQQALLAAAARLHDVASRQLSATA
ncbi:MAG TPA: glycoside hydrolase family protein [Vicinamibacterales bacterium]